MKRVTIILLAVLLTLQLSAQVAKKPSLMVVPSRSWCVQHGFMLQPGDGYEPCPDYRTAFDNSPELNQVVAKIGQMMSDRGFDLKMMSNALASLGAEEAEEMLLVSKESGAAILETPIDKLRKTAKADIWLEVDWILNKVGFSSSVTFNLSGIDAYTDVQIANCQGTGQPSHSTELPILLSEAVSSNLDNFNEQLMAKFNDWFENGRQVSLRIKVFEDSEYDLESEFEDEELGVIIENWVADNTVKSQFNTDDATEGMMVFSNVRIPMLDANGRGVDARRWGRGLQKVLKEKYGIVSKVMTRGLGQVTLVIGGK